MVGTDLANPLGLEPVPDTTALKRYTKAKQTAAREIRRLKRLYTKSGDSGRAEACQDLIVRLAEDRFTLAVVGQFKRGKSSLMNAVIGRDLLPTGVLPLTSAITILRYGPQEQLIIHREDTRLPEEAPVWSLAEYVTEEKNPVTARRSGRPAWNCHWPSCDAAWSSWTRRAWGPPSRPTRPPRTLSSPSATPCFSSRALICP